MGNTIETVNEYLDYVFVFGTIWVYLVIFLACFIENIFAPFPGDTFVIAAGGLLALQRLDPVLTFAVVNAGGMASVMLMYLLGRKYGREFFIRKDYRYFSAADILTLERKLARWGAAVLLVSRFVFGFRSALALAGGLARYPAVKMFAFSLLSYFAFTGLLLYIGFKTVENLDFVERLLDRYSEVIWPLIILAVAIFVGRRFLRLRKESRR
jgi:membrane protein DedA with SNARE-associated domain